MSKNDFDHFLNLLEKATPEQLRRFWKVVWECPVDIAAQNQFDFGGGLNSQFVNCRTIPASEVTGFSLNEQEPYKPTENTMKG